MTHLENEITAYLDGVLDAAQRSEVEAHLATCEACRAVRDRLAWLRAEIAALPAPPSPSPRFRARFQERLAAGPERGLLRWWMPTWRRGLIGLGAASAVAAVAFLFITHQRRQEEMALRLELLENYELVASVGVVETPDDVALVAHLDELREGQP